MRGSKSQRQILNYLMRRMKRKHRFSLLNLGLNDPTLNCQVLSPDLQGETQGGFRVKFVYLLFLLLTIPLLHSKVDNRVTNGKGRIWPLPRKLREPIFHLRGGVLPPTPPSDDFRDLFDDFNRNSDELPPLVPIEEGDITRLEEEERRRSGQEGSMSSRPLRQLRNRNVARSIRDNKDVRFCDIVDCIEFDQHSQEKIRGEGESNIFLSSQYQEDIDAMSREKWELLYDPTPSRALKRTRQQASIVAQQLLAKSHVSAVCLLDKKAETTGYTVLSDTITKKMDREERTYQKAMMICVQGIGASLTSSAEALDVVDGLGQSHHESLRSTKWESWGRESAVIPTPNIQPWASVIQQTLAHQNVPEYFQRDDTMKYSAEISDEEEVLQTTTCTPKDIYTDIKGWTTAFEVELFSFQTLDVKIDVREDTLDLRRVTILPGKAVMVKKPTVTELIRRRLG